MNSTNIIRELVNGSQVINKMREEVKLIVGMVLSMCLDLYPYDNKRYVNRVLRFEDDICQWKVMGVLDVYWGKHLSVEYWVLGSEKYLAFSASSTISGAVPFDLKHVREVHEALNLFVEGMAGKFPQLEERWRPLLEASAFQQD